MKLFQLIIKSVDKFLMVKFICIIHFWFLEIYYIRINLLYQLVFII